MTYNAGTHEFRCPGDPYPITRSVHLARMAAFYPKCRECPQNVDAAPLAVHKIAPVPLSAPRGSLFTAEGVRGVYLNELNRSCAGQIAGAFASRLWDDLPRPGHAEGSTERNTSTLRSGPAVVIGHDERPSSPDIVTGIGTALRSMGCQVIDIGLATRPCFRFAVDHLQAAAGVHVCGSGCDPAWTGLDFVTRGACPCSRGGELDRIESRFALGYARPSRRPGSQRTFRAVVPYEASLWKHFHALRPLRIAFACSSRPVRDLAGLLFRKLACQLISVPTPTRARAFGDPADADCRRTAQAVVDGNAHLGMLVDDDAQRCVFFDERGEVVAPRDLTRMLAACVLLDDPGRVIVIERDADQPEYGSAGERAANAADDTLARSIAAFGGRCVWTAPTADAVAQAMRGENAVFAGGDSGRFWFSEGFPACDVILTLAKVLQALSRSDAPFSEVASGGLSENST